MSPPTSISGIFQYRLRGDQYSLVRERVYAQNRRYRWVVRLTACPRFLEERITMRTTFTVNHNEHVSSRSFEEVVRAFESAVGSVEDTGFPARLASTKSAGEFESLVKSRERTSGFMRFFTADHGAWLARIGLNAKAQNVHNRQSVDRPDHARTRCCRRIKCSCAADDL
jgi:hypothetical protein